MKSIEYIEYIEYFEYNMNLNLRNFHTLTVFNKMKTFQNVKVYKQLGW